MSDSANDKAPEAGAVPQFGMPRKREPGSHHFRCFFESTSLYD